MHQSKATNIRGVLSDIDLIFEDALGPESSAPKDFRTIGLGLIFINIFDRQSMIAKTKKEDPNNFPDGFYIILNNDTNKFEFWFGKMSGFEYGSYSPDKIRQDFQTFSDNLYAQQVKAYEEEKQKLQDDYNNKKNAWDRKVSDFNAKIAAWTELEKQHIAYAAGTPGVVKPRKKLGKKPVLRGKPPVLKKPSSKFSTSRSGHMKKFRQSFPQGQPLPKATLKGYEPSFELATKDKTFQAAARVVYRICKQAIMSGIEAINLPYKTEDESLISAFKIALEDFNLYKKISNDGLFYGNILTKEQLDEHNKNIEEYRDSRLIPIARQVLPDNVFVKSLGKEITLKELFKKLNIITEAVSTSIQPTSRRDIVPPAGLTTSPEICHSLVVMFANLIDVLNGIILVAQTDISSGITLLGDETINENKVYEKLLKYLITGC